MPSILFASNHCYLEFASGAAAAARQLLTALADRGWDTRVLTGSLMDTPGLHMEQILKPLAPRVQTQKNQRRTKEFSVHEVDDAKVTVRVYDPGKWSVPVELEEGYPYLQLLDQELREHRPDVMLCFGGGWLGRGMLAVARRHGVPAVFWLRNTEYKSRDLFESVAGIIVPSRFSADLFKEKLGLDCQAIPSPVARERVLCEKHEPRFVTYVSPTPAKGVFYFARIASELGRLRPDIPILVVLGRGNVHWLDQTGLNLRSLKNLHITPATNDPRQFLRVTRAFVTPSLWLETFLRTAVEGMFNGIPTLASRRGAVPGTLGNSGFLFDIAAHHTPASRRVPSVQEVTPWVQTIIKLFNDPKFEAEQREKCLAEAERFMPERIFASHDEYLRKVIATASAQPKPISNESLSADLQFLQRFFKTPMELEKFETA